MPAFFMFVFSLWLYPDASVFSYLRGFQFQLSPRWSVTNTRKDENRNENRNSGELRRCVSWQVFSGRPNIHGVMIFNEIADEAPSAIERGRAYRRIDSRYAGSFHAPSSM